MLSHDEPDDAALRGVGRSLPLPHGGPGVSPAVPLRTTRGSDEPAAARAGCFRFDPAEQDRALALDI